MDVTTLNVMAVANSVSQTVSEKVENLWLYMETKIQYITKILLQAKVYFIHYLTYLAEAFFHC